jgi:signal transduction histidine kinase
MRRRLTAAIVAVAGGAVLLLAVPLALVLARSYRDEELVRLQRDAVAATRAIDIGTSRRDAVELPATTDALTVYDRAGKRIAGVGPLVAPALAKTALRSGRTSTGSGDGRLSAAVPLLNSERVAGALLAERSDAVARRRAHQAWLVLGSAAAAIVLIALLAAMLLGRWLARPLERLAVSARRLGEGDFTARAPRAGIREVDEVALALDSTSQRLGELVQRERAFASDASHQLRTPLASLRLEVESMLLGEEGDLELALAQIERLQTTIDTLLSLARDSPQRDVEARLGPLFDLLERDWRGAFAAEDRPLRVASGEHTVRAASAVVHEVLDVLLANALAHGRGATTMTSRRDGAWAFVDVTDEGPGFSDPATAFERRAGEGHGIGLALASALAHAEGGRLFITRPGPRPVVTLALPAGADVSRPAAPPARPQSSRRP